MKKYDKQTLLIWLGCTIMTFLVNVFVNASFDITKWGFEHRQNAALIYGFISFLILCVRSVGRDIGNK